MSSGFFRANKYCAAQVGPCQGLLSTDLAPNAASESSCFDCLTKPMESEIEDAIQAMTCDMYIYIYIYYADVQLYTIFNLPSKFFLFQSLSLWQVKHVNAERKICTAWNSVLEDDCSRPEVCELEENHHYHPDEFGSCHPG